jgi:predicted DNA-binding transcriptional regulator AlpA
MKNKSIKSELLNITQVAQHISVPVVTFRYWLKKGRFPVEPIAGISPKKWRVADVDAWLKGSK